MKKLSVLLIAVCLTVVCLLTLSSCDEPLEAPGGFTFNEDTQTLYWEKVDGALGYSVLVGEKEKSTKSNHFTLEISEKGVAALFEEFGQVFYVYAMAKKPMLAAPMIASYCIVSVILSRIFLKEKLKASQYACVITVIIGIVMLGISEGLAEA